MVYWPVHQGADNEVTDH